ncbi:hypothetical protein BHE74_00000766 [Ensete ventricosum]|nr:hypothetical protein BHE74_00000766 [Ensete ventricosum]RZR88112.1 hypothetical protein BHM03_00015638 [Ensete ventricosum]
MRACRRRRRASCRRGTKGLARSCWLCSTRPLRTPRRSSAAPSPSPASLPSLATVGATPRAPTRYSGTSSPPTLLTPSAPPSVAAQPWPASAPKLPLPPSATRGAVLCAPA